MNSGQGESWQLRPVECRALYSQALETEVGPGTSKSPLAGPPPLSSIDTDSFLA